MKVKIEAEHFPEEISFGADESRSYFLKKASSNRRLRRPQDAEIPRGGEPAPKEQAADGLEPQTKNQRGSRKPEKTHSRKPQSSREKKADYSSLKESLSYEQLVCAVDSFRLLDWDRCDPDKNKNSICRHS